MNQKDAVALAQRIGEAMLVKAIKDIGRAKPDADDDLGEMLLCMAIGVALNRSGNINERIPRIAAETWLDQNKSSVTH